MPGASEAMELGVSWLWMRDYMRAKCHFEHFASTDRYRTDIIFAMLGTSWWLLGEPVKAVEHWIAGLDVDYAGCNGLGLDNGMLIYFAGVFQNDTSLCDQSRKVLEKRLRDSRAKHWPGPLAKVLIGTVKASEVEVGEFDQKYGDASVHAAQKHFWIGVKAFEKREFDEWEAHFRMAGNLSWVDYDLNADSFFSRLWGPEYFLARFEIDKLLTRRQLRRRYQHSHRPVSVDSGTVSSSHSRPPFSISFHILGRRRRGMFR